MKGFHVCKAGNAPTIGQVKSLIVDGDRIRSKALDQGGANYTITAAVQRESYKDSYGNVGYDIEIEPANGQQSTQVDRGAVQPLNRGTMSKDDYWTRREERDIEASQRMNRSHAQEMAIRYFVMIGGFGDVKATEALRTMTDWFQRDSWRTASANTTTPPEPDLAEGEDVF